MTEETAEALKALILDGVNDELAGLATQDDPLPTIAEKNIVLGTVDLSRYESLVVVSIIPDKVEPSGGGLDEFKDREIFVVTMIFQKAAYPALVKRMFRYAKAFRRALEKSANLGGAVDDSGLAKVEFFPDTGSGGQTATAFEAEIWTEKSEEIAVNPNIGI